jgi:hypothetical protein
MNMLSHSNNCTAAPECGEPYILAVTGDDRSHNEGHRDQFDVARKDTKKPSCIGSVPSRNRHTHEPTQQDVRCQ